VSGQPPGGAGDGFGLVETLDRVRGLDRDLALAVAYDGEACLTLTPARDVGRALLDVLDHAPDIARARAVAACLTYDRDPQMALTRARDVASTADGDIAVADSADLLAVLLHLVDALRPRHNSGAPRAADQRYRVSRPARWLASMSARFLPMAYRWRYIAEYAGEMAGLSRRDQLAYAVRAASRTWALRRALISSAQHAPTWNGDEDPKDDI
jgi:hypothetical protein